MRIDSKLSIECTLSCQQQSRRTLLHRDQTINPGQFEQQGAVVRFHASADVDGGGRERAELVRLECIAGCNQIALQGDPQTAGASIELQLGAYVRAV